MHRKLTEEKLAEIISIGTSEFADRGFDGTSMSAVAQRAGISVGVLYKYYSDKEQFFLACLKRSLDELKRLLSNVTGREDKLINYTDKLIRTLQKHCKEHPDQIRMYHELTCGSARRFAKTLADEIEGITAVLYSDIIERAQKEGKVRQDINPKTFAFFFDNLLVMLQFSYCCDYYKERFSIYCGKDAVKNEKFIREEMLKFMESAFTLEQGDIVHEGD